MEHCKICGCEICKQGKYAEHSIKGRSYPTKHHCVAKRFSNDKGKEWRPIDLPASWEKQSFTILCFECHEELLHNPVLLCDDIFQFAELVRLKGKSLRETNKTTNRKKIGGRIELLHDVIAEGIKALLKAERAKHSEKTNLG